MSVNQKPKVDEDALTDKKTFMQVCKKWERRIAPAFGLLAFFTLVGIVIYNLVFVKSASCKSTESDGRSMFAENFVPYCSETECIVNCSFIDDEGKGIIALHVNAAISKNPDCEDIQILKLNSCNFQNKTLKSGWLKDVSLDVYELTISGGNLKEIGENALTSSPFEELSELILIELEIKTLKKKYFLGMKNLEVFEFRLNKLGVLHVEENALEGMPSLTTISYSQVILDDDGLSNSFGCTGALLRKLAILAVEHGRLEKLTNCSFTNIPAIQSIYLSGANLKSIDKNTFVRNPKIHLLRLTDNDLTTLENGTFNIINRTIGEFVDLGNNFWHCNCSLQWLKDDFLDNSYIKTADPPLCNNAIEFKNVDFCRTPATSTVLPPTTTPTPTQLRIDCSVHDESPISINAEVIVIHSVSVRIDEDCVQLEFQEYSTDPLRVRLLSNVSLVNYSLVWFDSNNKNDYGCEIPLHNATILKNLKQDVTYTFSVLKTNEDTVSPNCTFGFKTTAEWNKRPWIANKYRTIIISVLTSSVVIIIVLTILGTFFFIRSYPTVISGNKSVIVVKSKKNTQEVEPPNNFEKPVYFDPYLKPISQGYLTPKFHKYDRVKYRPPLTRSISEWSLNNSSSYDDPRQIYEMRILHSRLQEQNAILRNRFNDFRPPLPPPNGRNQMRLPTDFDEESLYNSV